jgi:hypothetical protein
MYVKNMLDDRGSSCRWDYVQDTVACELSKASMFLGGILDGCIIAECQGSSFFDTHFKDAELRYIQEKVINLYSKEREDQEVYANLSTLINFWKNYLPYKPLPIEFDVGQKLTLCDLQIVLSGDGALSGPIMHDILIPTFNAACNITTRMLILYNVDGSNSPKEIE